MTLLLIRHGETPLNVARVLQPADTPLSVHGQAQAEALGRRLARLGVAGILSSDLPRALATAQAAGRACGLPVQTSALLHERNFGDLRGRPYDSLDHDPLLAEAAPPGGESMAEFAARCERAWALLLAQRQALGGPLAVVSHGLVIRQWLQRPGLQWRAGLTPPERLANTSVTALSAEAPHQVHWANCVAHLADGPAENATSLSGG